MRLTKTMLIAAGMPAWDINRFSNEWPDGADITPENWSRAQKIGLTGHVLFAAVSTKEQHDALYAAERAEWERCYAEKGKLRDECEKRISALDKELERKKLEIQCAALIEALSGTERTTHAP